MGFQPMAQEAKAQTAQHRLSGRWTLLRAAAVAGQVTSTAVLAGWQTVETAAQEAEQGVALEPRAAQVHQVREIMAATAAATTAVVVVVRGPLVAMRVQVRAALLGPVQVSLAAHTPQVVLACW